MDQLKPANRWSSASSLTGLGLATTHLVKLEKQLEVVAKEAAALHPAQKLTKKNVPVTGARQFMSNHPLLL